jgi:hypothetical protein
MVDHVQESRSGLAGVWPHGHSGEGKLVVSYAKDEGDDGEPH